MKPPGGSLAVASLAVIIFLSSQVSGQRERTLIEQRDPSVYTGYEVLSPGYVVEWTVNWQQRRITFTATAQTRGYVAFGLSAKGRLDRSDIVIGGVANGTPYFQDRFGVDNRTLPQVDQSQDWELHQAVENGTHTVLRFSRAFDTCDQNDYALNENDAVNIIWAYGQTDNPNQEWPANSQNTGVLPVYLLAPNIVPRPFKQATYQQGPPSRSLLAQRNLQLWTINSRLRLPPNETTYQCTIHRAPRMQRKHHMVAFHTRLETEEARRHTHHIILYRCSAPPGQPASQIFERFVGTPGQSCYFPEMPAGPIPTPSCLEVHSGYAIGSRIFFYPDHVGQAMGENPDEYYLMQVHYDNPERRSDLDINVDFDIYYTDELRPNEAGMINVGHNTPGAPSILIPPSTPAQQVFGHCSSQCTDRMIPDEGINVFAVLLHTHTSGRRVRVRHFRGNQELRWISEDSNYDNAFQFMRLLHNEVTIRKGDQLTVQCENDNTWTNGTVVGGFATKQEMCLVFFLYYNKMDGYPTCRSSIENVQYTQRYLGITNSTWNPDIVDVVATAPPNRAGMPLVDISDNLVNWTPQLRRQLQEDQIALAQRSDCFLAPLAAVRRGVLSPQDLASGNLDAYRQAQESGFVSYPRVNPYRPAPQQCTPTPRQGINRNPNNNLNLLGGVLTNDFARPNLVSNFGRTNTNFGGFGGLLSNQINPSVSRQVNNLGLGLGNTFGRLGGLLNTNQAGRTNNFNFWTGLGQAGQKGQGLILGNGLWGKVGQQQQNGGWGKGLI